LFLIDWFLRVYAGSLPKQNSGRAAAGAPGATHSNLMTYGKVDQPLPDPGKTSLFAHQNEVSPFKTEIYPVNSNYKTIFPRGENEVYRLESSLQNEVYPVNKRMFNSSTKRALPGSGASPLTAGKAKCSANSVAATVRHGVLSSQTPIRSQPAW